MAEETTTARADPRAVRAASRSTSCALLSDFELGQLGRLIAPAGARRTATTAPISWDARDRDDRRRAARRRPRPRACSTPRAAPATRPRSSTSSSAGCSAPTTSPTARTCATSRAASRCSEDDRRRQGHGLARGLRPRGPDLRHRPEPGHEPPAHAVDAARGGAARRDDRRDQPAARGRADAVRAPAEAARSAAAASSSRSTSSRSRSAATRRSSSASARRCSSSTSRRRDRRGRGGSSDGRSELGDVLDLPFIADAHRRLLRVARPRARDAVGR